MAELSVLITTSGIGSRLGRLTEYTNKSLVRVGSVAVITRIIQSYPKNTNFVVTLGYYGDHVRQYLEMVHPNSNFQFVEVDNYDGPGSSQLYSISKAKDYLQKPFIFHACDTIASGIPKNVDSNWVSGFRVENADQYRTLRVDSNLKFSGFNPKGQLSFDLAYPGICGIKDYSSYWFHLEEQLNESRSANLSDCDVINKMVTNSKFKIIELESWSDIGNASELEKAREIYKDPYDVLDKPEESIYFHNNRVIKFFHNSELVEKRVKRADCLAGLVPEVTSSSKNFYMYEFKLGDLFSKTVTPSKMRKFLDWSLENMWCINSNADISSLCHDFYIKKTIARVDKFLKDGHDKSLKINGEVIPDINEIISSIDIKWLCSGKSSLIHGDLILDNVIEENTGFTLIDWRQDFANNLLIGDLYYDLAKLNHNLIFNHEIVNSGNYFISDSKDGIFCDIMCSKNLIDCRDVLHSFILDHKLDLEKVEILTSLVWINMSPLHEYPLDNFLFNFGKYNLFRSLLKRGEK